MTLVFIARFVLTMKASITLRAYLTTKVPGKCAIKNKKPLYIVELLRISSMYSGFHFSVPIGLFDGRPAFLGYFAGVFFIFFTRTMLLFIS